MSTSDKKSYRRKYYEEHKNHELNNSKKYRQENINIIKSKKYNHKLSARFSMLKSRAIKRKLDCTINYEQYCKYISEPCFYCKNKLCEKVIAGCGLDRLDNSQGYIEGNIVSCCKICNMIKGNYLTSEETLVAVNAIIEFRNK